MSSKTVMITGANRGIGKGLVAVYLADPNTTVVASVRDPAHSTSQTLLDVPKAEGSKLVLIQITDVASSAAIQKGISVLKTEHGISALDIFIGNAGAAELSNQLTQTEPSELQKFIDINAYGTLQLFKAVLPLLRASSGTGKFMYMSSAGGSLTTMQNVVPLSAYGASKALGNYLVKWLSQENTDTVIWCQHPGMVSSEMGAMGFKALLDQGIDVMEHVITVEKSTALMKQVIDGATVEKTQGKFLGPDGEEIPW
ncbi:hypothetical protein FB567DRAFT_632244 [Paraphoma chrysanthemicola]|uniref:Aflatoxin biosynthesis ketoreductase nor-1 n=1 Tax=Paraphoma chrysanthemicola TaxID=798071 RepID=A0A8K0VV82_9PLEO|nr:hypothetical protein FB567DRAFT_632244 [Paraphoma chrysanthemicola]